MSKAIDVKNGDTYGYLTIIKEVPKKYYGKRNFLCRCICGREKVVGLNYLRIGTTKSCGCMKGKKHGLSRTRIYKIWQGIVIRCSPTPKKQGAWKKYGAKGIRICEEWLGENGFINFYTWSMNHGYQENLTIDRINNNGNYCPENCRWVDYETQNCNMTMLCTNKSGYKGVSWDKKNKKWICVISINNHSVRIGAYKTQKEAVEARNNYIDKYNLPHQKNIYKGELSNGY